MKKIISLFQRNYDGDRLVRDELVAGAEWVAAGEGVATRKWDGTCVMYDGATWWARREVKAGKQMPETFTLVEHDETTGNFFGWEPAALSGFAKYLAEALPTITSEPGTYELCGPKINRNPEGFTSHVLVRHGETPVLFAPRDFDGLRAYLSSHDIEGIVWHHTDGRMVKIKGRDFGIKRGQGA